MAKKITVYSLLMLFALIISYVEGIAFSFVFFIPGFKLGLANTVSMYLISKKQIRGGIAVNFIRIILSSLLFGNFYSFMLSIAGGMLSTLIVLILIRCKAFSFAGISCAAAVLHNLAQLLCAVLLMDTLGIFSLLPIMIISGSITGFISGLLLEFFSKKYQNILPV
ncbi:MAG: Gx transporter family protein [Acutalibacteraceae bacterium]|nr:Gx transporter family protein [Acutalibacteraceae bacterium]